MDRLFPNSKDISVLTDSLKCPKSLTQPFLEMWLRSMFEGVRLSISTTNNIIVFFSTNLQKWTMKFFVQWNNSPWIPMHIVLSRQSGAECGTFKYVVAEKTFGICSSMYRKFTHRLCTLLLHREDLSSVTGCKLLFSMHIMIVLCLSFTILCF